MFLDVRNIMSITSKPSCGIAKATKLKEPELNNQGHPSKR